MQKLNGVGYAVDPCHCELKDQDGVGKKQGSLLAERPAIGSPATRTATRPLSVPIIPIVRFPEGPSLPIARAFLHHTVHHGASRHCQP
jgi:hypothetical protein